MLDREERTYFGLFPDADGFARARFESVGLDSVRVVVERVAGEVGSVLLLGPRQVKGLREFIEAFETKPSVRENRRYNVSKDYVDVSTPVVYPRDARRLTVVGDRGVWVGYPYYVADSMLVMRPYARSEYDWRVPLADAYQVPVAGIRGRERSAGLMSRAWFPYLGGALLTGLTSGALHIAGADGAVVRSAGFVTSLGTVGGLFALHRKAREVVPYNPEDVGAEASFSQTYTPRGFPSESQIDEALDVSSPRERREPARDIFAGRWGRVHVGMGQSWSSFEDGSGAVIRRVESSGEVSETPTLFRYPDPGSTEVEIALRLLRFVEAGVGITVVSPPDIALLEDAGMDDEVGTIKVSGLAGYGAAVLPIPRWIGYGGSLSLGGGVREVDLRVSRERRRFALGVPVPRADYFLTSTETVPFFLASAEVFVTPRAALALQYRRFADMGSVTAPGEVLVDQRPGSPSGVIWTEEPHEVTFGGGAQVTWGVRLHL